MAKKLPIAVPAPARLILDFIGTAEAPNGYVTIFGNRQKALKKPLTTMTIGERSMRKFLLLPPLS